MYTNSLDDETSVAANTIRNWKLNVVVQQVSLLKKRMQLLHMEFRKGKS